MPLLTTLPFSVQFANVKPLFAVAFTVCELPVGNVPPPATVPAVLGDALTATVKLSWPLPPIASYLCLAGRVEIVPVAGSTHGHGLLPKNAGFELRYIEFGIANPPGVLCQRCDWVRKS